MKRTIAALVILFAVQVQAFAAIGDISCFGTAVNGWCFKGTGHLLPNVSNRDNIGSSANRIANGYFTNLTVYGTLTPTAISYVYDNLNVNYQMAAGSVAVSGASVLHAVTGTTGVFTGTFNAAGQSTFGAAATLSTITVLGAAQFAASVAAPAHTGATLALTGAANIAGQLTFGAAATLSTCTVGGACSFAGTPTVPALNIAGTGAILMGNMTSTQISAATPGQAHGACVFNSTLDTVCCSSGAAVGAFILPKSTSTTSVPVACY